MRAISGEKTGFAYSDEIQPAALEEAARAARAIAKQAPGKGMQAWKRIDAPLLYQPIDPLASMDDAVKIAWLERVDRETRAMDPRVKQVMASCNAVHEVILVASSDGQLAADVRPLVRFNVSVIVEQDGRREQGYAGAGGRYTPGRAGRERSSPAARTRSGAPGAGESRGQCRLRPGQMPVVLGPGWPGILLHEAIGHGLEGDFNRKGTSAFSNRLGERVASEHITVVDDGTLSSRRGSLNIDDEGTPSQCTTLIEGGVLKGYLQDSHNARLTGTKSTGNGRPRILRAHDAAAHDQYLYAPRSRTIRTRSSLRWRRASTR